MENNTSSVTPMAMTYGLYLGLALILNSVLFYVMGIPFSPVSGYIALGLMLFGLGYTMRFFGEHHVQEGVSYSKLLGLGTLQALFAGMIVAFYTFVLFTLIDKSLMDKFLLTLEEQLMKSGINENQTDAMMTMYRKFMSPVFYSFLQIFSVVFDGFLFSLILAIFFKKKPSDPFYGVE